MEVSLFSMAGYQPAQLHKSQCHLEYLSQESSLGSYNSHKNPSSGLCLMRNEDLQHKKTLKVFFISFLLPSLLFCSHHKPWPVQMKPSLMCQEHEAVPSSPQELQSILNSGTPFSEAVPGGDTPKLLCTSGNSKMAPLIHLPLNIMRPAQHTRVSLPTPAPEMFPDKKNC